MNQNRNHTYVFDIWKVMLHSLPGHLAQGRDTEPHTMNLVRTLVRFDACNSSERKQLSSLNRKKRIYSLMVMTRENLYA